MTDASQGSQARLCIEPGSSPHTFDGSSEPYEFVSESVRKRGVILEGEGIRGTRSRQSERTRPGPYTVGGTITLHPSPAALDLLLPRILGAAESSDTFALAETLPEFGLLIDRVAETFQYTDCKVNRAVFRGRAGGLVELVLDVSGKTETTGTSYPSITPGTAAADAPYVFSDGVLTLQSSAREMMDFELEIDNALSVRHVNSLTATSITPTDRKITLRTTNPFTSDETDLYGQANAGAAGTLVFTNGNLSTTFTFAALQVPDLSPVVSGKREIPLVLEMTARRVTTTKELEVTHDATA